MNNKIHLFIVTTLGMIMTFILHFTLTDTRAIGFFFQKSIVDVARNLLLSARCLTNNETGKFIEEYFSHLHEIVLYNQVTCDYIITTEDYCTSPLIPVGILQIILYHQFDLDKNTYHTHSVFYTIISAWIVGRFFDGRYLWYQVDIFTMYFLIWQIMLIISLWEYNELPLLSVTIYRGWLCLGIATNAFMFHDNLVRYLPFVFRFCLFWTSSIKDM